MPTSQNLIKTPELSAADSAKTLGRVLSRAKTFESSAILLVEMPSENVRRAATEALETYLHSVDDTLVDIDLRDQKDLFESLAVLEGDQIASIHGLHAQPEVVRRLNWRREFFAKNNLRAVFWLTFEELNDLAQRAPDFWAFRNRQIKLAPLPNEAGRKRSATIYNTSAMELSNLSNEAKRDRIAALEELLESVEDPKSDRASSLRHNVAQLHWEVGHYEQSTKHLQLALKISREIGDRRGESTALGNLGVAHRGMGKVEKAIECYKKAVKISDEIGDRRREAKHLGSLGLAYGDLSEIEKAIEHYQRALEISREIGDRRGEGNQLGNLGSAHRNLGEMTIAIEHHHKALSISCEIGDRRGEGIDFGNLGSSYHDLGEIEKAIEHYQRALEISREIGDGLNEGTWLGNLGNVYHSSGRLEEALAVWFPSIFQVSQPLIQNTILGWLSKLRTQEPNFDTLLRNLFPSGDIILNKATGQSYTFFKDAPPDLPDQIIKMLDDYEQDNSAN